MVALAGGERARGVLMGNALAKLCFASQCGVLLTATTRSGAQARTRTQEENGTGKEEGHRAA